MELKRLELGLKDLELLPREFVGFTNRYFVLLLAIFLLAGHLRTCEVCYATRD